MKPFILQFRYVALSLFLTGLIGLSFHMRTAPIRGQLDQSIEAPGGSGPDTRCQPQCPEDTNGVNLPVDTIVGVGEACDRIICYSDDDCITALIASCADCSLHDPDDPNKFIKECLCEGAVESCADPADCACNGRLCAPVMRLLHATENVIKVMILQMNLIRVMW